MVGDSLTDDAKTFIRLNYITHGAKWCAHKLGGPSYSTIKRWANKNGLRRQFRRNQEACRMNVADLELEAINRRPWR
jgi:hypothetical protein